jgi:hypothetical protein
VANRPSSDGGFSVFNPARYVSGTNIQWGRLLRTIFGAGVVAWFSGVASVILGFADIPLALLSGLASFGGEVVTVVVGLPVVVVRAGFGAAVPFVLNAGPAGFLVAVGISLVTLYIVAGVVSRVG